MKNPIWLCLLFILFGSQLAHSQSRYTVQVGTFLDVQSSDFDPLRALGFVYAKRIDGGITQVFLGNYSSQKAAGSITKQLLESGYSSAATLALPFDQGQEAMMIQVATRRLPQVIEWAKLSELGNLYALIDGSTIKVLTGPFPDFDAAQAMLLSIRKNGYADAFLKRVNSAELVELSAFETGIKKELIPLALDQGANKQPTTSFEVIPRNQELTARSASHEPRTPVRTVAAQPVTETGLPTIRTRIKRRSALELQKVLKSLGLYAKSLDGYYGKGTKAAYDRALTELPELQKYQVLAAAGLPEIEGAGIDDRLQRTINALPNELGAEAVLMGINHPVSNAYRGYSLFTNRGPSLEVNQLMNEAIQAAYKGQRFKSAPPFDFRATYAYQDLDQLLLHMHYIHAAPGIDYAVPCWLYERHPTEANRAQARMAEFPDAALKFQGCDSFLDYPEVQLLRAIAWDLSAGNADRELLTETASRRAQLYLTREPLNATSVQMVNAWEQSLWQNLGTWANSDPLHLQSVRVLRIAYHQSQVRIEDYFMDQGFKAEAAKNLAVATLQSLVGVQLARFE